MSGKWRVASKPISPEPVHKFGSTANIVLRSGSQQNTLAK